MTTAEIKTHQGVPTLFIDGAPYPAYAYFFPVPVKEHIADFARAGVHLYTWGWGETIPHSMDMAWTGPNEYDYSKLDEEVETILSADPQAYLFPRIAVSAPSWWLNLHPDERVVYDDGSLGGNSIASKIWLREATEAMISFIKHVRSEPYGDHFIGYQVTGGVNEWFYANPFEHRFPDHSRPTADAFRDWLRKKYEGDISALRGFWKIKGVDFENANIPDKGKRLKTDLNLFRDPAVSKHVSDYYEFFSEIVADAVINFCKVGKKTTENESIMGAFYGYIIHMSGFPYAQQHAGHQALRKVLESPYVDFLCAPYQYCYRGPGGYDGPQSLVESVKLHGKLWFTECDHPTFLTKDLYGWGLSILNVKETFEILKRDFSNRLIRGVGMWWMDLIPKGGWYHHPEIVNFMSKTKRIVNRSFNLDRTYKGEIAVFVDEETPFYLKPGTELSYSLVFLQDRLGFSRIGAPYDIYLHNDISNPSMPSYKLYIFLNTFYLTEKERKTIRDKVQRDGNTVVWMYAPGFIGEGGLSIKNVRDLTGMEIFYQKAIYDPSGYGCPLYLYITDFNHPITRGIPSNTFFGTTNSIGPIFYCDDPTAKTLGRLLPTHGGALEYCGCEWSGFAVKEFKNWKSVFIGVPNVPSNILRNIAYYAGAHVYCDDDDVVYANKKFLAIHTNNGGYKRIKLPKRSDVYDAFSEEIVAKDVEEFTDHLPQYATKLYFLGDISKIAGEKV